MTHHTKSFYQRSKSCLSINSKSTANIALSLLVLTLTILSILLCPNKGMYVASASELEDMIDEDFISFYEENIASSPVITNMDKRVFEEMQAKYNLTKNKLIMLLVLENFGQIVNNHKTIDELTKMSDNQLISYAKRLIALYGKNLDDTQKETLKDDFLALLKRKSQQQNNLD